MVTKYTCNIYKLYLQYLQNIPKISTQYAIISTKFTYNIFQINLLKTYLFKMVSKMSSLGPESLLLPHRIWKVKFVGESVDDCGGGYSESIAEMCDELQVST